VTAHGRTVLEARGDERLIDLLNRHDVPWSGVSVYVAPRSGGEPVLRACLDTRLSDFEDTAEVLLYLNRNVNPFMFSLKQFEAIGSEGPSPAATEYVYQRLDNDSGTCETFLRKLSPEECRSIVVERVGGSLRETLPQGADLVVGVSGGGDSNALLHGLTQAPDLDLVVHPIMVKGIPDWDEGVPRAQELCAAYDLELTIVEEEDVKDLLRIPSDSLALIDRFEREFKGDDFEFLGTLLVRLALSKHARDLGTSYICTGLNLEDVLCENLYRLSAGLKPAGVPLRTIGDVSLAMPLWLCPKRIIDGCFPRFSRENYDSRYPCFSLGRNLYYSIVYTMQSQYPGWPEQMAQGLSELAADDPVTYRFDQQLGFHVERFVPFPLLRKFQRMLADSRSAA
jgi:tRNA(Ile)-lysidine synthase TilS/MesJ